MRAVPWRQRLSWQLWMSHFTVVVITLVALVGSMVLVAGLWLFRQGHVLREPALDAQVLSIAVGNLVRRGALGKARRRRAGAAASGGAELVRALVVRRRAAGRRTGPRLARGDAVGRRAGQV